jgi:hypothetical protein
MVVNLAPLYQRVIELLLEPKRVFSLIGGERDSGRRLISQYVLLLAAVAALCAFLGNAVFGHGFWFSLTSATLKLLVFMGSVWVTGFLVTTVAPSYGSQATENTALKLVSYAATPICVTGVFMLIPQLSLLAVLAGFGWAAYLFNIGCQILLHTPPQRAWAFAGTVVGVWFAMVLIATAITTQIAALLFAPAIVLSQIPPPHPMGL